MMSSVKLGRWFFKNRSFTPLPVMVLIFLLFPPVHHGTVQWLVTLIGVGAALTGEGVRFLAVGYSKHGTSGRESYLRAEALNCTGLYSLVRNPLYVGNLLIFTGVLAFYGNLYGLLIMDLFLGVQYFLIVCSEEEYLEKKYGAYYADYKKNVPRFFPFRMKFKSPDQPFLWKKVVLKESDSVFNMLFMLLVLTGVRQKYFYGSLTHRTILFGGAFFLIAVYVIIKILKKRKKTA